MIKKTGSSGICGSHKPSFPYATFEKPDLQAHRFGSRIFRSEQYSITMCLTFQPAHQNGTRSSTVCFAIFPKTGKDNHLLTLKPLLI